MDIHDPEFQALLGAYAAGTLTEGERKRLFEKALGNQELFDQLMDEESMREALDSPFVKRALAHAIEKAGIPTPVSQAAAAAPPVPIRRTPWWVYGALAASLVFATTGLYLWLNRPLEQVAQVPPAKQEVFTAPQSPAPKEEPKVSAPVPAREEPAPLPLRKRVAPPAAAAPPSTVPAPPSAKLEVAEQAASPPAPAAAELRNEFRASGRSAPGAMADRIAPPPTFRISQRILSVPAAARGYVYLLKPDGDGFAKVEGFAPLALTGETAISFPLPAGLSGEVRLFFAVARDAELDASPRFASLPPRNWQVLKIE
ncbi:MAG: hypothetical protein NW208_02770 [Bryobacter sp.]|nr:hypothetical protein [Bryobacter sp.]